MDSNTTAQQINGRPKPRLIRWVASGLFKQLLCVCGVIACAIFLHYLILNQSYGLSPAASKLVSKTTIDNGQVSFKNGILSYNQQNQSKDGAAELTVSGPTNSTSKQLYRVSLASKVSSGIQFTDASSNLPFKLVPLTSTSAGRYINGHMEYPSENAVGIYTLRRNGIKEDIILNQSPGSSYSYSWKLELGSQLAAKMLPDGGVGIYSANPLLSSSSLQVSDAKSQALIDKAKKAGKKDTLMYMIPAPYIKDAKAKLSTQGVRFSLTGSTLTLHANNLTDPALNYPLTIDPTITVTTSAQFQTGYDDGNIDYLTADEIDRGNISLGTIGAWNYTHNSTNDGSTFVSGFMQARESPGVVAYNGYIYILGGDSSSSANDCTGTFNYCNGVQFAKINSDGTIGAWNYTHNSTNDGSTFVSGFTQARTGLASIAYNGYLYVIGGQSGSSANDCTGTSNQCNGVQFAPINADGTVGTWSYTHNSTNDGATFSTGFIKARDSLLVAYNGYLYIIGGTSYSSGNDCTNGSFPYFCSGVQFAPINADGTVGTWNYTHNSTSDGSTFVAGFTQARGLQAVAAYNGYLYISGGESGTSANDCTISGGSNIYYCNGVQFAKINSDGTIGAWDYTHNSTNDGTTFSAGFTQARSRLVGAISNGYLYILGGQAGTSASDCTLSGGSSTYYCNGVQFAPINADGTVGTWSYTHNSTNDTTMFSAGFTTARADPAFTVYNGYLYLLGGYVGGYLNDVQYSQINTGTKTFNTIGTWNYTHNSTNDGTTFSAGFTQARFGAASVAYNGYLYILGGASNSSANDCTASTFNCSGVQFAPINVNGTIGAWHYTHNSTDDGTSFVAGFITARWDFSATAYNGYLYIMGGHTFSSGNDCTSSSPAYCNGVEFAAINGNGTIGTWSYTHNSTNDGGTFVAGFTQPRWGLTSVAYNGYLYVLGGVSSSSANDCTSYCSGVQFAPINGDGTIGTWNYTHNSTNDGTTFSAGFTQARRSFTATAYNGYLYILGGYASSLGGDCTSGYCNGVQFAPINGDGTIGTWNYTHNSTNDGSSFIGGFTYPRLYLSSVAYNGYLYIVGGSAGFNSNDCTDTNYNCNGVQFAPIETNGTIGAWHYTHNSTDDGNTFSAGFTLPRQEPTATAYNGYIYVMGGHAAASANDCTSANYCNGVQFAPINTRQTGMTGTWNYTHDSTNDGATFVTGFTKARYAHTSIAYNGYIYVIGGYDGGSSANDCGSSGYCNGVQFAPINADGTIGTWNYTHNSTNDGTTFVAGFTQARRQHTSVVYNGYLYVIGGVGGVTGNDCTGGSRECNGIQFAPINADGTIGTWNYTHNSTNDGTTFVAGFNIPRYGQASVAYNGYLYVIGGSGSGNDCVSLCNGVQFAKINSDGTIGSWNYTYNGNSCSSWAVPCNNGFIQGRWGLASVAYNGYLYITGGVGTTANDCNPNTYCNGVEFAPINADGTVGTWNYTYNGNSCSSWAAPCNNGFTENRYGHSSVAYNGFLYVIGGYNGRSTVSNDCNANSVCSGIQYAQFNSNGTVGGWSYTHNRGSDGHTFVSGFNMARYGQTAVAYNGSLYILGGQSNGAGGDCSGLCNGVQFTPLYSSEQSADYEKVVDLGSSAKVTGISFNGRAVCGLTINYRIGNGSGVYGAQSSIPFALPGITYTTNQTGRYVWVQFKMDDAVCGTRSQITDFTLTYNSVPAAPTLYSPSGGATGVSALPTFQLKTTDADGDYLRYKIVVNNSAVCNSAVSTIDQTASQTGWSGQDQQTSTAYTGSSSIASSTMASLTYQVPSLSKNTTYYWTAYAIDPGGSNSWSASSTCQPFTTGDDVPSPPVLISAFTTTIGGNFVPNFKLHAAELNSDYLDYKIDVCADSACSSIVRTIDQTVSQTGWSGQDQQTGTAYTGSPTISSSTIATYIYQAPNLSNYTNYWWRAYAIDPGGSNTWSGASPISGFITAPTETHIQGNVKIQGSVKL